ncbi:MAG: IMP cyclohydrolase [Oscillospiraceae bacterium]|nr:IMP cyclohydrolase [Oscillospiraceae bacterium]
MKLNSFTTLLNETPYPGRGILIGRSQDNSSAIFLYFIMGRSLNSRNRVFEKTGDGIRTRAHDFALLTDPSLIIYHPVRIVGGSTVVTNGDQTDTIADFFQNGHSFQHALRTREYEPDAPNYTPRISGLIEPDGSYVLSILKSAGGNPACCVRNFFEYSSPIAGTGHFISTYQADGNPLPSFEGEPAVIDLSQALELEPFAQQVWNALNEDNKVSLYACQIDLKTFGRKDVIINKNS